MHRVSVFPLCILLSLSTCKTRTYNPDEAGAETSSYPSWARGVSQSALLTMVPEDNVIGDCRLAISFRDDIPNFVATRNSKVIVMTNSSAASNGSEGLGREASAFIRPATAPFPKQSLTYPADTSDIGLLLFNSSVMKEDALSKVKQDVARHFVGYYRKSTGRLIGFKIREFEMLDRSVSEFLAAPFSTPEPARGPTDQMDCGMVAARK